MPISYLVNPNLARVSISEMFSPFFYERSFPRIFLRLVLYLRFFLFAVEMKLCKKKSRIGDGGLNCNRVALVSFFPPTLSCSKTVLSKNPKLDPKFLRNRPFFLTSLHLTKAGKIPRLFPQIHFSFFGRRRRRRQSSQRKGEKPRHHRLRLRLEGIGRSGRPRIN